MPAALEAAWQGIQTDAMTAIHARLIAVTQLSLDCVLAEQLPEADRDVSFVPVGAVGTAEDVSGEFLGHLVSHGCLLCQLFAPSQGTEALRG